MPTEPGSPDPQPRAIAAALAEWFAANRRDLPWRPTAEGNRDPYAVLVSELMLQQTQVARVIDAYRAFMARFPTIADLAAAPEDDVLAAWAGLGYYRRARLLHAAAKAVAESDSGRFPETAKALQALPGVGRYTAGAVASLAFGAREPAVDGNVLRVLQRLHADDGPPTDRDVQRRAWQHATELVEVARDPAVCNEALIELGALVCTPRNPTCDACPLRARCRAAELGRQHEIPPPKARAAKRPLHIACLVVRDDAGRVLLERRPAKGLWASMWQPPAIEHDDAPAEPHALITHAGLPTRTKPARAGDFTHHTTHRDVRFVVYAAEVARTPADRDDTRWLTPAEFETVAISNAHRRALGLGLAEPDSLYAV